MKILLTTFLILIQFISFSQTEKDFTIVTGIKDTLFRGFNNEIKIISKYDLSKSVLISKSAYLMRGDSSHLYFAKISSGSSIIELKLIYPIQGKDTLIISFPFTVTNLTIEKANRLRSNINLPPVKERKYQAVKNIELILPNRLPDHFDPVIISSNRKIAFLGNPDLKTGTLMDLHTKKNILNIEINASIEITKESVLSNTGRYITNGNGDIINDGDSIIIAWDLFKKRNLKIKFNPDNLDYYFKEFSSDDKNILITKTNSEGSLSLELHNLDYRSSTEFLMSETNLIAASLNKDGKSIYTVHQSTENTLLHIQEIETSSNAIVFFDSISLLSKPFLVKIEFQSIIIGFENPKTKIKSILIYSLTDKKIISEIELPKFEINHYINYEFKTLDFHINPEKSIGQFSFYNKNKIEIYSYHLNTGTFIINPVKIGWYEFSPDLPTLLENEIIFGQYQDKENYLDSQKSLIFWYNIKNNLYEEYEAPLVLYSDGNAFFKKSICDEKSKNEDISLEVYKYKNGKKSISEIIKITEPIANQSTFRFGTIINSKAITERNFAYFDFDLKYLNLKSLHEFKNYTVGIRTITHPICEPHNSIDIDSIRNWYDNKEIDLISNYDESKSVFYDKSHGGFIFCNHKAPNINNLVKMQIFKSMDWILYCSDHYYTANFKSDPFVQFGFESKVFPFEQFDLKYNRPDIILERLGYADSNTINLYHKAYIKRLKKMNFTEDMLSNDFNLPYIKLENYESLPKITDTSSLNLHLDIKDFEHKLDRINIYINNVAIYGRSGIDLREKNIFTLKKQVNLSLSEGENKIQVSVLNQAGAESYKETVYVTYNPKTSVKPNLYLITIGDSKYADSRYDLTYASKDATDIKNAFAKNANSIYGNVFTYTYTDEQVTKENILKLKTELLKAKRDDVVMITIAGHGVLDNDFNYYLATHNMDFSNPSENGLPYEDLESLLDGIAPLKKVLFLDACHSGEVDKEEVEQIAMNTKSSGTIKFRNAGAGIQKKNMGLKSTSELMGELFTDLRKGTGATVISSAGGVELAMESDQWKNGLFTYCLLHGIQDKAADVNKDGKIMLSELQNYLRIEVTELSKGAQQPTSRIENLSMDFRIW